MKNTLVQYKGGGYDGCIWEWNWLYFDEMGKFHDIYSSGVHRAKTEGQARNMLDAGEDLYLYDLANGGLEELNRECHAESVVAIAEWLGKNVNLDVLVTCNMCGNQVDAEDIVLTDFQKDGGIVYTYHGKICSPCHSLGSCEHCGKYCGEGNLTEIEGEWYCPYCVYEVDGTSNKR